VGLGGVAGKPPKQNRYRKPVPHWAHPRSNPATYTGLSTASGSFFPGPWRRASGATVPAASASMSRGALRGLSGDGILRIEMHFLPDVYVPCEVCRGLRYNRETLEVRYKDKNIAEVLDMTVEEALSFFEAIPGAAQAAIPVRCRPGLYPPGPAGHHLSGGEASG